MKTKLLYSIFLIISATATLAVLNNSLQTMAEGISFRKSTKNLANEEKVSDGIVRWYGNTENTQATNSKEQVKTDSTQLRLHPRYILQQYKPVEKLKEVFYTIQVGVYPTGKAPSSLLHFETLLTEQLPSGMCRYAYGQFISLEEAEAAWQKILQQGISDAFIAAYINSQRYTISELKQVQTCLHPIPAKYEKNNQAKNRNIIFFRAEKGKTQIEKISATQKNYPSYTLLLGTYQQDVPNDIAALLLQLRPLGIQVIETGNQTQYRLGAFKHAAEAEMLQEEIQALGLVNAKIIQL